MVDNVFLNISSYSDLKDITLIIASIIGVPFLLWRYYSIHKTANAQAEQAKIAEQQHITDRIARAFQLIANDKVNDTIGAIYALERIANDSPRDQWSIMQYLADYVRRKISLPPDLNISDNEKSVLQKIDRSHINPTAAITEAENLQSSRNIDAALHVLGTKLQVVEVKSKLIKRLLLKLKVLVKKILFFQQPTIINKSSNNSSAIYRINLSNTDLSGKNLAGFDLSYADLRKANLTQTNLAGANLEGADLRGACLNSANLRMANLEKADLKDSLCNAAIFINAHLEKTNFWNGSLEMAIMIKAKLNRAIFINAKMRGANLIEADINGAIFSEADLQNVHFNNEDRARGVFLGAKW